MTPYTPEICYTLEVTMPRTKKEGLQNFVQLIINRIEKGDYREALLTAVDLREELECSTYDAAISAEAAQSRLIVELERKHKAELAELRKQAFEDGQRAGVASERGRIAALLGVTA
jgi:hypothetical protein